MSEYETTRPRSAQQTYEMERKARLRDAMKFAVAIALGAAVLLSYPIILSLRKAHFSEALVSAVQLSHGFYPPP